MCACPHACVWVCVYTAGEDPTDDRDDQQQPVRYGSHHAGATQGHERVL